MRSGSASSFSARCRQAGDGSRSRRWSAASTSTWGRGTGARQPEHGGVPRSCLLRRRVRSTRNSPRRRTRPRPARDRGDAVPGRNAHTVTWSAGGSEEVLVAAQKHYAGQAAKVQVHVGVLLLRLSQQSATRTAVAEFPPTRPDPPAPVRAHVHAPEHHRLRRARPPRRSIPRPPPPAVGHPQPPTVRTQPPQKPHPPPTTRSICHSTVTRNRPRRPHRPPSRPSRTVSWHRHRPTCRISSRRHAASHPPPPRLLR